MIRIRVKVTPNAHASSLVDMGEGTWLARLKSPPVDGRANHELVALVARHFDCPKSAVSIRHGSGGRMKLVEIARD